MNALPSSSFASLEKRKVPPESALAQAVYANYEGLGDDRSFSKLIEWYKKRAKSNQQNGIADVYVPSLSTLKRWSYTYNWQQRLADYERKQLEERRKKRQAEIERMDSEHAVYGRVMLGRSIEWLEAHFNDEETTVSQAIQLMKASYELERLARGAATSRIEADTTMTILPKEYINISESDEGSVE